MNIEGTIISVSKVITGSSPKKQWQRQDFVLETRGQYPRKIAMSLWGDDKINKYDLQFGLKCNVYFEIESREHNGRWYTEVRAWKIEWNQDARHWQPGNQ